MIARYLAAFAFILGAIYAAWTMAVLHGADQERQKAARAATEAIQQAVREREAIEAQHDNAAEADRDAIAALQAQLKQARENVAQARKVASVQGPAPACAAPPSPPKAGRDYNAIVFDQSWASWLSDGPAASR